MTVERVGWHTALVHILLAVDRDYELVVVLDDRSLEEDMDYELVVVHMAADVVVGHNLQDQQDMEAVHTEDAADSSPVRCEDTPLVWLSVIVKVSGIRCSGL